MSSKKHLVHHHNMFGPCCEVEGVDNEYDFKIYCHKEHKICVPKKCNECEFFAGSEMGKGVCCAWEETYEAVKGDDHTVQHDEVYFEFQRVVNPDIYEMMMKAHEDDDFDLVKAWFGID